MNYGLGVIRACDAVKDLIEKEVPGIRVVRTYLETFDWNVKGATIIISPDSTETSPKSHGVNERASSIIILLYKNLEETSVDDSKSEIDELIGILERLLVLFSERQGLIESEDLYSEKCELSTEGVYSVDALAQGKFMSGLRLTTIESFSRE